MQQGLITIGMLAGGLGLFLLAVNMITDGLTLAAGHALRDMLGKWTSTLGRGIVTGVSITAIVQSSSAVTVATIGFVNAGLLSLYQTLGVARAQVGLESVDDAAVMEGLARYRVEVVNLMKSSDPEVEGFSIAECEAQLQRVQVSYDDVKEALLHAGAELRIPVSAMIDILEQNSAIRRMARQMYKAIRYLGGLYTPAEVAVSEAAEVAVQQVIVED